MAERTTGTAHTTTVRHIAKPLGERTGPFLGDLRAFVAACDGLPDDLVVMVDRKREDDHGRRCVELRTQLRVPVADVAPAAQPPRPVPGPPRRRAV